MGFKYGRDFYVLDIANSTKDRAVFQKLVDKGREGSPAVARLQSLLEGRCLTVIVERDYIDFDHRAAFAHQYSTRHLGTARRCTRLHFFACSLNSDDLLSMSSDVKAKYLGFSVIRPLPVNWFGPTILSPRLAPQGDDDATYHITCPATYWANIAGNTIRFLGAPWMQPDGIISECATAALWMCSWHMSHRYAPEFRVFQTPEIVEFANRSLPPLGPELTLLQMTEALKAMGYQPVVYAPQTADQARQCTYWYIESGMPVIVQLGRDSEFFHAVTVVGHAFSVPSVKPQPDEHDFLDNGRSVQLSFFRTSDFVPSFIVQDDVGGPFCRMSFAPAGEDGDSRVKVWLDIGDAQICGYLSALIIPLPAGVSVRAERAEANALSLLGHFLVQTDQLADSSLVIRTMLTPSNDLKQSWTEARGMSRSMAMQLRQHLFAKWVWVTEVCEYEQLRNEGLAIGQIVEDASAQGVDVLAMLMPRYLELRHPRFKKVDHDQLESRPFKCFERLTDRP